MAEAPKRTAEIINAEIERSDELYRWHVCRSLLPAMIVILGEFNAVEAHDTPTMLGWGALALLNAGTIGWNAKAAKGEYDRDKALKKELSQLPAEPQVEPMPNQPQSPTPNDAMQSPLLPPTEEKGPIISGGDLI